MNITEVKTAFKIADVEIIPASAALKFVYLKNLKDECGNVLPQSILAENVARVYLIVVDGEILKIGGSQDKGGMKGTLRIYQTGGVGGRPSIRSYGIWYFLFKAAIEKHKVEFYMIYQENFNTMVKGLLGLHEVKNAALNYKLLEECCESDYKNCENGKYPKWNIQEQGGDWPQEVKKQHADITIKSTANKTKKGRKEINSDFGLAP